MFYQFKLVISTIKWDDWIQLLVPIVGVILSTIAILQSKKSIELTKISIHEANRPMVVVYLDYVYTYSSLKEYLVIKNFGETFATIDRIDMDSEIKIIKDGNIFSQSLPFILAPTQSFSTVIRSNVFNDSTEKSIQVVIQYHDKIAKYTDTFNLNQHLVKDMRLSKTAPSKNASIQKVVSYVAEEIMRKNL